MNKNVTIIGAGSWGTAISIALAKKGPTGSFATCTEVQLKSSIQHGHQNSRLKLIRTTHPDPLSRV